MIEIGRSLDIPVAANGVATRGHAELMRQLGCATLQGFAFAEPVTAAELETLLLRPPWRVAA